MFCSECGTEAGGKFCFNCGSPLQGSHLSNTIQPVAAVVPTPVVDWENEVRYDRIIQVEVVREAISAHASKAVKGLSGEQFLAIYDKIVSSPIPLEKLASVVQPMYASWGVRTGKQDAQSIDAPIGVVIARALCSLAKHAQPFQRVDQADEGCTLIAEFPSSIWALKGEIRIAISKKRDRTHVAALTNIPGQMFDWGKSRKSLERLFVDLNSSMGLPNPNRSRAA